MSPRYEQTPSVYLSQCLSISPVQDKVISSLFHIATVGGSTVSQYSAITLLAWRTPKSIIFYVLIKYFECVPVQSVDVKPNADS